MGFMDTVKGWFGGHKDQAAQGVDKTAGVADEKTGGSHSDQVAAADEKAKDTIEKLGDDA
jgi:hypothetical protein